MSRVVYATARDGALPPPLSRLDARTGVPGPALLFLWGLESLVFVGYYLSRFDLAQALLLASAAAIAVYVIGSAAGLRLHLKGGKESRAYVGLALASLILSLGILPFVGEYLWPTLVVGLLGALYGWRCARRGGTPVAWDVR